jgi:hypothetical protein
MCFLELLSRKLVWEAERCTGQRLHMLVQYNTRVCETAPLYPATAIAVLFCTRPYAVHKLLLHYEEDMQELSAVSAITMRRQYWVLQEQHLLAFSNHKMRILLFSCVILVSSFITP